MIEMSVRQENCVALRLLRIPSNGSEKVVPVNSGQVRQEPHFQEISKTICNARSEIVSVELFFPPKTHTKIDEDASTLVFKQNLVPAYLIDSAIESENHHASTPR